jgi:tetratricopeptide (TPR) repeat protein
MPTLRVSHGLFRRRHGDGKIANAGCAINCNRDENPHYRSVTRLMPRALVFSVLTAAAGLSLAGSAAASGYSDLNAGISARNRKEPDRAIPLLTQAIAASDLLARYRAIAYFDRGQMYSMKEQYDLAIADFSECIKLKSDLLEVFVARAGIYALQGKTDLALADYDAAIRLRPDLPDGYQVKANTNEQAGRFNDALADYASLIQVRPQWAMGYYLRSNTYRMMGDFAHAQADIDTALKFDPKNKVTLLERAQLRADQGQLDGALNDLNKVLRDYPDNSELLFAKGLVEWKLGQFRQAADVFTRAMQLSPTVGYLAIWLDMSLRRAKWDRTAFTEGLPKLNLTKWPNSIVKLYSGTTTLAEMQKDAAAAAPGERADRACAAAFYGGEWLLMQGDNANAKDLIQKAATDCPAYEPERNAAALEIQRWTE